MEKKVWMTVGIALTALGASAAMAETMKIGALPAADAIVLYVASDEGLFQKAGLD
ncbi:secreted protein, partial [gut metagenome]